MDAYLLALQQMLVVLDPPWELSAASHLGIQDLEEEREDRGEWEEGQGGSGTEEGGEWGGEQGGRGIEDSRGGMETGRERDKGG
jgi:hypothetical protein